MTNRRYSIEFSVLMVAYGVLLVAAIELVRHFTFSKAEAAIIGLTPVLPLLFLVKTQMDRFRSLDELQQRIMAEALVFAFACTAVVVISYGFLQIFIDAPNIIWLWVWPVQGAFWMLGNLVAQRRYTR